MKVRFCIARYGDIVSYVFLSLTLVLLLSGTIRIVDLAVHSIDYPYQLDFGEGTVFHQVRRMMQGESIYPSINEPPFIATTYTPAYHYAVIALDYLVGNPLKSGRLLSCLYTFGTAILLALCVWTTTSSQRSAFRIAGSLFAFSAFLSAESVAYWGMLMRVDMQAFFFSFLGVYLFLKIPADAGLKIFVTLVPLVLAAFTRQTVVAGLISCCLYLLITRPKTGLLYSLSGLLFSGFLTGAVVFKEPEFWDQAFYIHLIQNFDIELLYRLLRSFLVVPFFICIVLSALYCVLVWFVKTRPHQEVVLSGYFVMALALCITAAKVGAYLNYLVDAIAIVCLLSGIFIARHLDNWLAKSSASWWKITLAGGVSFALLLTSLVLVFKKTYNTSERERIVVEKSEEKSQKEQLNWLGKASKTVISENMLLLQQSGRAIYFEPFIMTQLAYAGVWDEKLVISPMQSGEVEMIILNYDPDNESDVDFKLTRFTPIFLRTLENYYLIKETGDSYRIFIHKNSHLAAQAEDM